MDLLGNANKISGSRVAELTTRIAERKISGRSQGGDWHIEQNCPEAAQFLKVVFLLADRF